ncbi:MAG: IS66 family insertion sequence element accessory protein TnpB [Alteromonadales bacterium]|nr:IS66 family insertion sequence element accessory protein TnpB [Alteromonadales bacterium]
MANIHRTSEQWQQIFKQHASSGLQIAAFCKQQKLNTSSFYAWRKRLSSNTINAVITDDLPPVEKTQNDWVNVLPEQALPSQNWDIELALPNGVILRMMNN